MQHHQLDPKISVSIVFVASMFMSIMDTTIVNVALPSLARWTWPEKTEIPKMEISSSVDN
jgi:hypothetical protein